MLEDEEKPCRWCGEDVYRDLEDGQTRNSRRDFCNYICKAHFHNNNKKVLPPVISHLRNCANCVHAEFINQPDCGFGGFICGKNWGWQCRPGAKNLKWEQKIMEATSNA